MRNIESYKPEKKVARKVPRGFSKSKNSKKKADNNFDIKSDPKVIINAVKYTLVSGLLITLIVFSAYKIIRWKAESDSTNDFATMLQQNTKITTITEPETNPNSPSGKNLGEDKFKNIGLIDADISELRETNGETVGWINVPGTSINYPFVKTDNNDFYLYHTFDGHWSDAGWVFLDYRNQTNLSDQNQIIYAHGRIDGSMFGSLQNILSDEWQNNPDNHFVKTSTDTNSQLWQVFSVYRIPKTNDYITVNFNNDSQFQEFANMVKSRSTYDFQVEVNPDDKILTLSTCIGTDDRAVLHAKLVKVIEK